LLHTQVHFTDHQFDNALLVKDPAATNHGQLQEHILSHDGDEADHSP